MSFSERILNNLDADVKNTILEINNNQTMGTDEKQKKMFEHLRDWIQKNNSYLFLGKEEEEKKVIVNDFLNKIIIPIKRSHAYSNLDVLGLSNENNQNIPFPLNPDNLNKTDNEDTKEMKLVSKIMNDHEFIESIKNTKENVESIITNYAMDNGIDINGVDISDVIKKVKNQLAIVRAVGSKYGGKKRKTNRNKKNKRKSRKLRRKSKKSK